METLERKKKFQKNATNFFQIKEEVVIAEIKYCLNTVSAHLSLLASGKTLKVLKSMCPDSEILNNMKLDRAKISYIIVHGLSPFFQKEVENEIVRSEIFSVSFDESFNKVSDTEQLDIIIRYWDDTLNIAKSKYLTSSFLGHTTAADLLNAI